MYVDGLWHQGSRLKSRFERYGGRRDIDAAINCFRAVLGSRPLDCEPLLLSELGDAFRVRSEHFGDPRDLDEAIDLGQRAVRIIDDRDPKKPLPLSNLGIALRLRFERSGRLDDLAEAVEALRRAVRGTPRGHPNRAMYLSNCCIAVWTRFERLGELPDIDEAVDYGRESVELTPSSHPDRPMRLANLAGALQTRYQRLQDLDDLEKGIEAAREAVARTSRRHVNYDGYRNTLAMSLAARFRRFEGDGDLEAALTIMGAVAPRMAAHPNRLMFWLNYSGLALARYTRRGSPADLATAVDTARTAVTASSGRPEHAACLEQLSHALFARFNRFHEISDLREAIEASADSIAATPRGHADRPARLVTLAVALTPQVAEFRVPELPDGQLLDLATSLAREAVTLAPAGSLLHRRCVIALSTLLQLQFEKTGVIEDIDESVIWSRAVVQELSPDHPRRAQALSNLALALQTRFEKTSQPRDLAEAIAIGREAVATTASDDPALATRLSNLAIELSTPRAGTPANQHLDEALDSLRIASELATAPMPTRIRAAVTRGRVAAQAARQDGGYARASSDAYGTAVGLLPAHAWRGLGRPSQERGLAAGRGLASEAAASMITSGDQLAALTALETGRGVLWSQHLDNHGDLTALRAVDPALADHLAEVGRKLDSGDDPGTEHPLPDLADRQQVLIPSPMVEVSPAAGGNRHHRHPVGFFVGILLTSGSMLGGIAFGLLTGIRSETFANYFGFFLLAWLVGNTMVSKSR